MKQISVIIPVYKPGIEIEECLNSLSAQTFKDFEIILCLNGSDDESQKYCSQLIRQHSELDIKLIVIPTAGVSNARNRGLEVAGGEYIAFIDADDLVSEKYLEGLISSAGAESIIFSDVMTFCKRPGDEGDKNSFHTCYLENKDKGNFTMTGIRRLLNGPWGKLYKRKDLDGISFNTKMYTNEDALFNFIFSRKIKGIGFAPGSAVYYYRINPEGVTMRKRSKSWYLKNAVRVTYYFTLEYIRNFPHISFLFYLTRLAANCKYAVTGLRKNSL